MNVGTGIALGLGGLAVVLAASGATYAVAASTVNIADSKTPSRIATVDATGHLSTTGAVSTIDSAGYLLGFQPNTYTYLTSPTTASLAISRIRISNPAVNNGITQQIALVQLAVGSSGSCDTGSQMRLLGNYDVTAGSDDVDALPAPLLVKPVGTTKYCVAAFVNSSTAAVPYYLSYSLTAYVHGWRLHRYRHRRNRCRDATTRTRSHALSLTAPTPDAGALW